MPTNTPTPRDLDPNAPKKHVDKVSDAKDSSSEKPMIVHRQPYTDNDGVQKFKEHRVPVSEWTAYEKEHNL